MGARPQRGRLVGGGASLPSATRVFILTHRERKPVTKQAGTTVTFVTDGIRAALEQAEAAAGDKDAAVGGDANVIQQYLRAGLLDKLQIHVVPVLLDRGVGLFGSGPGAGAGRAGADPRDRVTHRRRLPQLPGREVSVLARGVGQRPLDSRERRSYPMAVTIHL
jgi:hypothetical protein